MRVAALYDIHGNLPALEAVLDEPDVAAADVIVVGGDVLSGPLPGETVELLGLLGSRARFVRGNGDREPFSPEPEQAAWIASRLSPAQRRLVGSFEEHVVLDVDGLGPTLFCHATPRSDEEVVLETTPDERFARALAGIGEPVVVCGHTHMQFDRRVGPTRVVNAGSVGMPYEGRPGAYWALLGADVALRRTVYDLERAAERIRAAGSPGAVTFARENVLRSPAREEALEAFERLVTA